LFWATISLVLGLCGTAVFFTEEADHDSEI
jgi:hypothetical protein